MQNNNKNNKNNKRKDYDDDSKEEKKVSKVSKTDRESLIETLRSMFSSKRALQAIEFVSLRSFDTEGVDCDKAVAFFMSHEVFSNYKQITHMVQCLLTVGELKAVANFVDSTEKYMDVYPVSDLRYMCAYSLANFYEQWTPRHVDIKDYIPAFATDKTVRDMKLELDRISIVETDHDGGFQDLEDKYEVGSQGNTNIWDYTQYFAEMAHGMIRFVPETGMSGKPSSIIDFLYEKLTLMDRDDIEEHPIDFYIEGSRLMIKFLINEHGIHVLFNGYWCEDRKFWDVLICNQVAPADFMSRLINYENLDAERVNLVAEYNAEFTLQWRPIRKYFKDMFDADGEIRSLIFSFAFRMNSPKVCTE